uniref:Uncharacterized protein n=1 Tax=Pediastrum duplex TaxID=3105 RepID=A0A1W5RMK9_PEDDU|nr:hypothetical protein [Pediastrum duplex]AQU64416.1 hypothetical protein [Pediastrum duplex]
MDNSLLEGVQEKQSLVSGPKKRGRPRKTETKVQDSKVNEGGAVVPNEPEHRLESNDVAKEEQVREVQASEVQAAEQTISKEVQEEQAREVQAIEVQKEQTNEVQADKATEVQARQVQVEQVREVQVEADGIFVFKKQKEQVREVQASEVQATAVLGKQAREVQKVQAAQTSMVQAAQTTEPTEVQAAQTTEATAVQATEASEVEAAQAREATVVQATEAREVQPAQAREETAEQTTEETEVQEEEEGIIVLKEQEDEQVRKVQAKEEQDETEQEFIISNSKNLIDQDILEEQQKPKTRISFAYSLWEESTKAEYQSRSPIFRFIGRVTIHEQNKHLFDGPEALGEILRSHGVEVYAFQMEVGELTQKQHFQMFLKVKKKIRAKQFAIELNHEIFGIEIQPAIANDRVCIKYCTKDDTRVQGPWVHPSNLLGI